MGEQTPSTVHVLGSHHHLDRREFVQVGRCGEALLVAKLKDYQAGFQNCLADHQLRKSRARTSSETGL